MTENEALRYMVSYKMGRGCKPQYPDAVLDEAFSTTITALKEIQQYRKFGTLEEFYKAKKYIDLAKNHGTIGEVIDECAEYEAIGTVEECREAVEKQKVKEPIQYGDDDEPMLRCPSCDENVTDLMDYGFNFALIVEKGGTENEIPKRNVHR